MRRRPLQAASVLSTELPTYEVRTDVALREQPNGEARIVAENAAFDPIANLLAVASADAALAAKLDSDAEADACFASPPFEIAPAPPGEARDELARYYREELDETPLLVCVREGDRVSAPIRREDFASALHRITTTTVGWKTMREREARQEAHETFVRTLTPNLDLSTPSLEPWIEELLAKHEEAARTIDALEANDTEIEAMAVASAKRRVLLIELAGAGLFDASASDTKRAHLARLGLTTLAAYYDGAMMLQRYLRSDERARTVSNQPTRGATEASMLDPDVPLLACPISIDWFRKGSRGGAYGLVMEAPQTPFYIHTMRWLRAENTNFPPKTPDRVATPFEVLAFVEGENKAHEDDRERGSASILIGGACWATMRWRTDDGVHPKLLSYTFHVPAGEASSSVQII